MPDHNPTHSVSPEGSVTPWADDPAVTPSVADSAATTGGSSDPSRPVPPPTAAGRYRIGEQIAHGGMGVIYRATDAALGREVAVKVLSAKYAPDSAAARRFADEARIAAQLQHPAIPPVHDLGTLPDGRPFLAMKLIKGSTLDALLADRPDPGHDRGRFVAAFEQVCQAVAYAHAHHVIHRDLKPANVMVGSFGEVQVMDWGLAKVLTGRTRPDEDGAAETAAGTQVVSLRESDGLFTQAGSVLGTPAFMPPEQAVGAVGKVDERSDVFGLGAILAVVLTGQPPFAGHSSETIRVQAAQGNVGECFARLDRGGAEPGLVALCKRCLAATPADRPAGAGAVARAVAELRQAADERARQAELDKVRVEGERTAAEARAAERRKRRRVWQGAAVVLAAAVVGGLGAVLAVQRRANADLAGKNGELAAEQAKVEARNRALADEQAKVEARNRQLADEQAKVQKRNRELADEQVKVQNRFELARKAIETFHTGISEDMLLRNEQFKELRAGLLRDAAGFYADLEKLLAGQTDVRSRKALAAGFFQLGELTEQIGSPPDALAVHRKALAMRRELAAAAGADVETRLDVVRSLNAVGCLQSATGDKLGALATFQEGRGRAERLVAEGPTDAARSVLADSQYNIGRTLSETGKPGDALEAHRTALDIRQRLVNANPALDTFQQNLASSLAAIARLLSDTGKSADALRAYLSARDIRQKLTDSAPSNPQFRSDLAASHHAVAWELSQTGKTDEALTSHQLALAIRRKLADSHPAVNSYQEALASSYHSIGFLLSDTGKSADALRAYQSARDIRQKLADANPTVTSHQKGLAQSDFMIGELQSRIGKLGEAMAALKRAHVIRQKLADDNPTVTAHQSDLAWNHNAIGDLLWYSGKLADALGAYEKGRAIRQKLADDNPTVTDFQTTLALSHSNISLVLSEVGKLEDALAASRRALDIRQKLADANPTVTLYQSDLARSHNLIGKVLASKGRSADALAAQHTALDIWQKLADANPTVTLYQQELALSESSIGAVLVRTGQFADALASFNKARGTLTELADANPTVTLYRRDLAGSYHNVSLALARLGKPGDALAATRKGLAIAQKLADDNPDTHQFQSILSNSQAAMARLIERTAQPAEAVAWFQKARDVQRKLVDQVPIPRYQLALARTHNDLGVLLGRLGRWEEARAEARAACGLWEQLVALFPTDTGDYRIALGGSYCNYGNALRNAGEPAAGLEWYDRAVRTLQPVHEKAPADATAKQYLRNSYWGRAIASYRLQKYARAVEDWDRAIALTPVPEQSALRAGRATARVRADMVAEAVADVAELAQKPGWAAIQWYNFACVYAVAGGKVADKKSEYADRAMELLGKAVKAGYRDVAHLRADTDLDPLRDRDDFRALVAELEKKFPPQAELAPPPREKK